MLYTRPLKTTPPKVSNKSIPVISGLKSMKCSRDYKKAPVWRARQKHVNSVKITSKESLSALPALEWTSTTQTVTSRQTALEWSCAAWCYVELNQVSRGSLLCRFRFNPCGQIRSGCNDRAINPEYSRSADISECFLNLPKVQPD